MLRSRKSDIVDQIKVDLGKYQAVVFCRVAGVRADKMNEIRRRCFEQDNRIMVTKHNLFKIASAGSSFEPVNEHLKGASLAAVYGQDSVGLVKSLSDISKTENNFSLMFGFFVPGRYCSDSDLKYIATLPSFECVRATVIGRVQGVMSRLVMLTKEPMRKILFLLMNGK